MRLEGEARQPNTEGSNWLRDVRESLEMCESLSVRTRSHRNEVGGKKNLEIFQFIHYTFCKQFLNVCFKCHITFYTY